MNKDEKILSKDQQEHPPASADVQQPTDETISETVSEINKGILKDALDMVQGSGIPNLGAIKGSGMSGLGAIKGEIKSTRKPLGNQSTVIPCDTGTICGGYVTRNINCT
jgi:hypothetical protein